jgi:hypothetical protein
VRPSREFTAGKNPHTFFVLITAKRWFPFQEARIKGGIILKNFLTIPDMFVWEKYIVLISYILLCNFKSGSESTAKLSTRIWRYFNA